MKVSQEPLKILDIFKDKTFAVPLYQREYSWSLEQVSDLFYDLLEANEDGHFLGSLLLYQSDESSKKMELVDGQQRVTTILLLLSTILKELDGSDKITAIQVIKSILFVIDPYNLSEEQSSTIPRLETGMRDNKLFRAIICNQQHSIYIEKIKSHKNLMICLDFFRSKMEEIRNEQGLNGLVKFTEKVTKSEFIVMTAEKQSDKLLLFKTINARGRELTQGDLIKNELCRNSSKDKIEHSIQNWDKIRAEIENNAGILDVFLFHYLNSLEIVQELRQELDKRKGIDNWNKKNYPPAPEKYLFEIYSELIRISGTEKFVENLLKSVKNYSKLINPAINNIYLNSLKSMGVNKCFPLLLAAQRIIKPKNFEKLCNAIDSLTFRHSILRKDPKELEKFYYQLIDIIIGDSEIEIVIDKIKDHSNFKDEEKFKQEFITSSPKITVSRMILDRITRTQQEGVNWLNKDSHIEHIMPQKANGSWKVLFDKDEIEYKENLNRLGNLTILQDKKNIKASNNEFEIKKEFYKTSSLKITNSIVKYKTWNYDQITKRQTELYNLAKDIWK